jgi:hypothetical protein
MSLGNNVSYQVTITKIGGGAPLVMTGDKPITIPAVGGFAQMSVPGAQVQGTVSEVQTRYEGTDRALTCISW